MCGSHLAHNSHDTNEHDGVDGNDEEHWPYERPYEPVLIRKEAVTTVAGIAVVVSAGIRGCIRGMWL